MKQNNKAKHAINVIEKSMVALDLSQNLKTDPSVIRSILREMQIDDFESSFPPMNNFLREAATKPQSLKPMFENIKKGLATKHPAIIEFLELALEKKWLKKSELPKRSAQFTFILEAMTVAMCNDHTFHIEVENHYRSKTKKLGLDNKHIFRSFINSWNRFSDFFKVAKIMALDPIMIYFRVQKGLGESLFTKPELKKMYEEKKINYFEYKLLYKLCGKCNEPANKLVRINIFEAGITEYKRGLRTNAISAYVLSEDLKINSPYATFKKKHVLPEENEDNFYKKITGNKNLFMDISISQEWVSLYSTWNMAFILGNLENLDLLFPKLLMPSMINAKSNNYLGVRVISLWLSINHFLFRSSSKVEVLGPKNKIQMAKAWAEINKKYAMNLASGNTHLDSKTLMKSYHKFFRHPFYALFKIVKSFFRIVCK